MVQSISSVFPPEDVHSTLHRHMLADGMPMVLDMKRSQGLYIYDKLSHKRYIDYFTFFASVPLGLNPPEFREDQDFLDRLMDAALNKVSNSDLYTEHMARFVDTFSRVGIPDYLSNLFMISGGALAVENALKTAFDWKVRKNFAKGYRYERGHKVIYFEQAFHGRSGYTMSLTNTDPNKVALFPKFEWCKVVSPHANELPTKGNLEEVKAREALAIAQIKRHFRDNPDDIAAIIIEPIQAEGGDNHFRPEFLQALRDLADENEALLIFDEVQTGVGITGTFWMHEQTGVKPDIVAFGKKMQVCGILAGDRVREVQENVFEKHSRINSTWGGSLVDMVRSEKALAIIEQKNLLENVRNVGASLLNEIHSLAKVFPEVENPRGLGLMCAFDLPSADLREKFRHMCYDNGLIILGCGTRTVRFRPALNMDENGVFEGMDVIKQTLSALF